MDSKEIEKQLNMTYDELVKYLQKKYGMAKKPYFATPEFKSVSTGIRRTGTEGLYCHHIKEYKEGCLLSTPSVAKHQPYEYQLPENLVYANVLEHLILHLKIEEETGSSPGFINICRQINDFWGGYSFKELYYNKVYSLVDNNFEDYIRILLKFIDLQEDKENLPETLYQGIALGNVKKIIESLNIKYKIINGEIRTLKQIEDEKNSMFMNKEIDNLLKSIAEKEKRERFRPKRVYEKMLSQANKIRKNKKR